MNSPVERLRAIKQRLLQDVMDLNEIISEVTTTRPGLAVGLPLLTAQAKLAEAASALEVAQEKIT